MSNHTAKKVSLCTLGCRVNQYESRAISEFLEDKGFEIVPFGVPCDAFVINTCAVTSESERKSRQMVRRASKISPNAPIAVTGCASQLHPSEISQINGVVYVGGNGCKMAAAKAISDALNGSFIAPVTDNLTISDKYEEYSVHTPDHTRAYIKIQDGCENKCAYCIIPRVRGPVRSRAPENVLCEARAVAAQGYKEIVLTGIETCSYQHGLAALINRIAEIDGIERIRLSSVNPAFITEKFTDSVKNNKKFCPHLHLSLQSMCDKTLAAMRRKNNCAQAAKNCAYLRQNIQNICFTADLICGFPGETDEDFAITLENTERLGLLFAHIFPYSDRPDTEASKMSGKINEATKNARCAELREVVKASQNAIISEFIKNKTPLSLLIETEKDGYFYGHTENFIECKIKAAPSLGTGKIVSVTLTRATNNYGEYMADAVIYN